MRIPLPLRATAVAALALAAAAAAPPPARAADLPPEFRDLVAEGRKWFREAGNTELGTSDRNAARVRAWKALWPAREMLDRHDENHPGDMDRIDREFGEIRMMVHWLKKESPIGLLEATGVGPARDADAAPSPTADWGPKPKDPPAGEPPPAAPPSGSTPPSSPPPGSAPAAPPPAAAEPPIEAWFASAESYEAKHRFDLPGVHSRYLAVVTRFSGDPSHPLFQRSAAKAGDLEGRMKDAYRVLRDEDPDSLKGVESEEVRRMVITVGRDLRSSDAALRERAARLLGLLGRSEAVYPLGQALRKEEEQAPARAMGEALVRIGGARAADALGDLRDEELTEAFDHLLALAAKNRVDRRFAAPHLGRFGGAEDFALFQRMIAELRAMGYDGAIGLTESIRYTNNPKRLGMIIEALGTMKEPAVVRVLAGFLQPSRVGADTPVREAAMNAIRNLGKKENLGEEVVPFLFVGLRHAKTRHYTTEILRELTGQDFSAKQWGKWPAWWRAKHPDWKEEEKD